MSKSVLVIDTPKNCGDCPIKQIKVIGKTPMYACIVSKKLIIGEGSISCPLEKLPSRREELPFEGSYADGYNACLEDIEKCHI